MVDGSAADMLDHLSDWIMEQVATIPIRSASQDAVFVRAIEACQTEALRTFRSSGSFDASIAAGKRAFKKEIVDSHMHQSSMIDSVIRSSRELWIESEDMN